MNKTNPMEHPTLLFTLTSDIKGAHHFLSKAAAEAFLSGIKAGESQVRATDGTGRLWAVRVGPWMWARDLRPKTEQGRPARRRGGSTGPRINWTAEIDARLGREEDKVIAKDIGCTSNAVTVRRNKLGISSGFNYRIKWTAAMDALLGSDHDRIIAQRLGCCHTAAWQRRHKLGIPDYQGRKVA